MGTIDFKLFILLLFSFSLSLSNSQDIVANYQFENLSVNDIVNNNDGLIFGGVSTCIDRFRNPCGAIRFNGVDGFIRIPNSNSISAISQQFSVSFWFRIDSLDNNNLSIICKGDNPIESDNSPQYRIQTFQGSSQSTISINTDFTEYDTDFLNHFFVKNKWNFYVVTYDGSKVRAYLNSHKMWEFPYHKTFYPNTSPLFIGRDIPGNDEFYKGDLDDLKVFNAAIDEIKIQSLFLENNGQFAQDEFTLACPQNLVVATDLNSCSKKVNYAIPTLILRCDANVKLSRIEGLPQGAFFPLGSSRVTYKAESQSGYVKTVSFRVIVFDNEPPKYIPKNDTTIIIANNSDSIRVKYSIPFFYDNCSIANVILINGTRPDMPFTIGETLIKYRAVDKAGNFTDCAFKVIVKKKYHVSQSSKTIVNYNDIVKDNDFGRCGAVVDFKLIDLEDSVISINKPGNFFQVGKSEITIQNRLTGKKYFFTITVRDRESPQFSIQRDTILYCNENENRTIYYFSSPMVTDNCGIDSLLLTQGKHSGDYFELGTTTLTFKALDYSGNSSIYSYSVKVEKKPHLQPIVDISAEKKVATREIITYNKQILKFNNRLLTLRMFDNNEQDFDTISAFFNGYEIVNKELLTIKTNGCIVRTIYLNINDSNSLVFQAWNIGKISPNTLMVQIFEGDYSDRVSSLDRKKPIYEKVINSKPGFSGGLFLIYK